MTLRLNPRTRLTALGLGAAMALEAAAAAASLDRSLARSVGEQALALHFLASVFGGLAAASLPAPPRRQDWLGLALFLAVLAFFIPFAGLVAAFLLALVLVLHARRAPAPAKRFAEIPQRHPGGQRLSANQDPGVIDAPLAGKWSVLDAAALRRITLGMEALPARKARPLLHRLRHHPDVRVQLFANGLLTDQIERVERRLAELKARVRGNPNDEFSLTALVEVYDSLFADELVPADETAQTARQALAEADAALALFPANGVVLAAKIRFLLALGDFRKAAIMLNRLQLLPGHDAAAAALYDRIHFEYNATKPPVPAPAPADTADGHDRPGISSAPVS